MRVERLKEREEKYLLETVHKTRNWKREFIVYQWYETSPEDRMFESKLKLIIDMLNISLKVVRVVKERVDDHSAMKKVYYLDYQEIDFRSLLEKPFIAKRRSVNDNIFLDRFIESNRICEYLLEIEDQDSDQLPASDEYMVLRNVTDDESYLNINMAVPFTEKHLQDLDFITRCYISEYSMKRNKL